VAAAEKDNLRLVTTEKDLVRLARRGGPAAQLHDKAEALQVMLEFENLTAIGAILDGVVRGRAVDAG
jgi:tetraacyldisaccharide-1-P 4'-kinase